jgi:DGQHR domain-containing protein
MVKSKSRPLEIPCIELKQGDWRLYGFAISAKKLNTLAQINRKDLDKEAGYQRALSESRRSAIAKYIDNGNPIPNAILIAFDDKLVTFSPENGHLVIPDKENIAWVIDGQHRLAGASVAEKDIDVFVLAFLNLDVNDQVHQFVVVNKEAKGVPTSLYIDLLKQLPPQKSEAESAKERAADISSTLRQDANSLFYNRIVYSSPQRGQMSLTNFVRKVSPLVHSATGKFRLYTLGEQTGIINNFFKALENVFPQEFKERSMRFLGTLGFGGIMNALPTIFDITQKNHGAFRVEDVSEILMKIDDFDFSAWDLVGSGSSAEIIAGNDLVAFITERMEQVGQPGSLIL